MHPNDFRPTFTPFWWLQADTRMVEAFSAFCAFAFSGVLFFGWVFSAEAVTRIALSVVMPGWAWSIWFLVVWACQSYAMCGNVFIARLPSALFAFITWFTVAGTFFFNNPFGFAPYIHGILAAFMAWIVIKGPTNGSH
jgi:hypothetical protein